MATGQGDRNGSAITIPGQENPECDYGHVVEMRMRHCFGLVDSANAGERVANTNRITVEVVRKSSDQIGLHVNTWRWVTEWLFTWIVRNRGFSFDVDKLIPAAVTFAPTITFLRRIRHL